MPNKDYVISETKSMIILYFANVQNTNFIDKIKNGLQIEQYFCIFFSWLDILAKKINEVQTSVKKDVLVL